MQDEIALTTNENNQGRTVNRGVLDKDIYTVQELAVIIGVHTTTILTQIKQGRLKALALGGPAGYRVYKEDVLNWVRSV